MNKSEYKAFDNYAQELSRLQIENQQLKESNETLNKMLLILNDRLDEYKRIYGEL